jgi:branched-chain amino acid transport system permease protein
MKHLNNKFTMKFFLPVLFLVFCLTIPGFTSGYMLRVLNIALITYLCVLSLYVILGMCGQNSLAQAGLWGVGAYIAADLVMQLGFPPLAALLISSLGTALFAFVIGFAFFRMRLFYFTFASVGLMTILNGLFMNWKEVTGGALGISNIPSFSMGGIVVKTEPANYYFILTVCVIVFILMKVLFNSALGRSFMAIRDNEIAANCLGINSLLTKSIAFGISGALCGAAGALYAFLAGYLSYQTFTYQQSTMYLIMIMLGGTISPTGALIGTMIISLMQEWVRPLQNYMQLIYGAGIMILMIVQPEGILGGGKDIYDKYIRHTKTARIKAE